MKCLWCEQETAKWTQTTVFWELPDGTQTIEITDTPSIHCSTCRMDYLTDEETDRLEDQLLLIDTRILGQSIKYEDLMSIPRLLKRNYFKEL